MSLKRVSMLAMIFIIFQSSKVEGFGLVEMISDYAKVAKNTERLATDGVNETSTSTTLSPEDVSEQAIDYEDFDDLQEEDTSQQRSSSTETYMKYFNGLVSLLTLMYKFNGRFGEVKTSKLQLQNQNEPRDKEVNEVPTGKKFHIAQDRFEFPQKKFRYHENSNDNTIDQQNQPVENYPPYNPLKANTAETYNQEDKKTSYEADLMQYDLTKNSITGYSPDVDIQQSYSYEIPDENHQPISNDNGMSWNTHDIHPVYHPWMTKTPTPDKPLNDDTFHSSWNPKPAAKEKLPQNDNSYKPWKDKGQGDSEGRQPWHDQPIEFPIYHHDFKDTPTKDHHFEYHEIEHPMDEDRVNKKPYSYYFLGRKLWYIPLLFSVYFIIYIGALVLKSIARHKIQFPEKIWNLHDEHFGHGKNRRHRRVDDITENYEKAIEKMKNKFM